MDELICKISERGNSLGVILPAKLLKEKNIKKGDHIKINEIIKVKIKIEVEEIPEINKQLKLKKEKNEEEN